MERRSFLVLLVAGCADPGLNLGPQLALGPGAKKTPVPPLGGRGLKDAMRSARGGGEGRAPCMTR